ncbi:alpha/beta hydrolase family protein [Actinocatenispora rupis]|uniref:Lipase n=1 Tax=Actinocatenispora rupis TaxID=519421 RepID=A0A8J3J7J8_9ACTN|nr:alpha/beta hydrolase [Actinocatenispora rupis]GID13096.1 lipase [Actinocatenispora rupis]
MAERRDVLTRSAPPPDHTVRYGPLPDHVADVWLPSGGTPRPLVLFLHGGYWRAAHDRHHVAPLAADLAGRGWAVACPEYRRTGGGGGWPATFEDVAAAVDAVPGLVEAAAPGRLAPGPAYLAGHSAGGHLALWSAVRHRLPAGAPGARTRPPAVRGVLALAPVCDLAETYRRRLDLDAARALMGGGPGQLPERYAAVDPARLPAPDAPTVMLQGPGDGRVPIVLTREYARTHDVPLIELDGADHFAVIDPESAAWPAVVTALTHL